MFVKKDYLIFVILLFSIIPIFLLPFLELTGRVVHSQSGDISLSLHNTSQHFLTGVKLDGSIQFNVTNASSEPNCLINYTSCESGLIDSSNGNYSYRASCYFVWPGEYVYNVSCDVEGVYISATSSLTVVESEIEFIENKSFVGVSSSSLVWGDVNGNGYWDLVYGGRNTSNEQSLYKCLNNDGFECNISDYGFDNGAISLGDVNLDGNLDMLVSTLEGSSLISKNISVIYSNDLSKEDIAIIGKSGSFVLFDYDNDGRPDVIASDSTGVYFYRNTKDGFVLDDRYSNSSSWCRGMLNPFRQGGDNFLLTCGEVVNLTDGSTFYGLGENLTRSGALVLDLNNNNKLDFIISSGERDVTYYLYNNNKYDETVLSGDDIYFASLAYGDYNNNNFIDVLVFDSQKIRFYKNTEGSLVHDDTVSINLNKVDKGSIAFFDYNNNGRLDLAVSGGGKTEIFNNNFTARINTKPYPPEENFTSYYQNGKLHLGWGKGWDNVSGKIFTDGLYYNLEVKDAYNNLVVSGKYGGTSNPTQGYLGNMFQQRNFSLNITEAKYKWRVQTIDAGLKASDWSEWQTYNPASCTTPENGDWTINSTCTYNDSSLNGNIYIESSGSLTLTNQNLNVDNIRITGQLILRNSTLTSNSTNFEDYGNLSKKWHISVNVLNESQEPLSNYELSIINNNSKSYSNNNYAIEYFENSSDKFYYNNYTITVSKDRYESNSTNFLLDSNKEVTLILRNFVYPLYSDFENEFTTNFYEKTEQELINLSTVTIGNNYGEIKFNENVNVRSLDMNSIITIERESITVRESGLSNKSAELVFKNLPYISTPVVLKDGVVCENYCSAGSYNAGILKVNVTGFSTYTLQGNAEINVSLSTDFHDKKIPGIPINFNINYYRTTDGVNIGDNCNLTLSNGSYKTGSSVEFVFENVGVYSYVVNCSADNYDTVIRDYSLKIYPNTTVFVEEWSGEGVMEAGNIVFYEDHLFFYSNMRGFDKLFIYNNSKLVHTGTGLFHGSMIVIDIEKNNKKDILMTGLSTKTEVKLIKKE